MSTEQTFVAGFGQVPCSGAFLTLLTSFQRPAAVNITSSAALQNSVKAAGGTFRQGVHDGTVYRCRAWFDYWRIGFLGDNNWGPSLLGYRCLCRLNDNQIINNSGGPMTTLLLNWLYRTGRKGYIVWSCTSGVIVDGYRRVVGPPAIVRGLDRLGEDVLRRM